MSLERTTEQRLLADAATRWIADADTLGAEARWRAIAGFGWLAVLVPEADGGLGRDLADACALAEALGAGPAPDPWLPVAVQAAGLLAACTDAALRARWLPALADGALRVVPATHERGGRGRARADATRARRDAGGWVLDGIERTVPGGDGADAWLVAAVTGDEGPAVFVVTPGLPGLRATSVDTVDGGRACRLDLEGVRLGDDARLAGVGAAESARVDDRALVVACAESVGSMDALLRETVAYLRTRVQFGRPLAANQALRHRVADLAIALEEARSAALAAVLALEDAARGGDDRAHARAAAGARAKVGAVARRVAEEAIQLHGGMGVTDELRIARHLKRQLALDAMLGSPDWHLRRHATLRTATETTR
ncbi:MAG: pimeloyl-CoA dehydrogenase small subunit [Burkholderiales bacterium]|nr:MAG: pimeloyl-CoA dehydrogenase small subunit [Burkholderiales bacterium]